MSQLTVSSPAFREWEPIPDEYGYTERNVNPPFRFAGVPNDAETLAMIVDTAGKVWDHWVVWNIPTAQAEIPQEWSAIDAEESVNGTSSGGDTRRNVHPMIASHSTTRSTRQRKVQTTRGSISDHE